MFSGKEDRDTGNESFPLRLRASLSDVCCTCSQFWRLQIYGRTLRRTWIDLMIPLQAQLSASKEEIVDYVNVSWELL